MEATLQARATGRAQVTASVPEPLTERQEALLALMRQNDYERASQLARDAGVSESVLSRWINGKTDMPQLDVLRRVAACLRVRPGDLMVISGARPEELGMVTPPLPPVLQDVMERLNPNRENPLTEKEGRMLQAGMRRELEGFDDWHEEVQKIRAEPRTRNR